MSSVITPKVQAHWARPSLRPAAVLQGDMEVDVAVIGAGYSGLSAAYHLHKMEPGLQIGVFEAGRIGAGASGVNSGQCSPRIGPSLEHQLKRRSAEEVATCHQHSLQAMRDVVSLVQREGIACDLMPSRQLQVALNAKQAAHLDRLHGLYRSLGFDVGRVEPHLMCEHLPGASALVGGLSHPAYALNPERLCAGLHRVVREGGASVFEESAVTRMEWGSTVTLHCRGWRVRARQVVVATDGAARQLGLFGAEIFPVRTFCAATEPLSADQMNRLRAADVAGFFDARHAFNFVRFTPDHRILIGGEYCYAAPPSADKLAHHHQAAQNLHRELMRFFPSLHAVRFERVWSGLLGCTLDGWPIMAPVGTSGNAWFVGAWNGHGVALATASGKDLAQWMRGHRPAPRPWIRRHAPSIMAACWARPAISTYFAVQKLKDRIDHYRHRKPYTSTHSTPGEHHAARP